MNPKEYQENNKKEVVVAEDKPREMNSYQNGFYQFKVLFEKGSRVPILELKISENFWIKRPIGYIDPEDLRELSTFFSESALKLEQFYEKNGHP